jgi:hypothetical protein
MSVRVHGCLDARGCFRTLAKFCRAMVMVTLPNQKKYCNIVNRIFAKIRKLSQIFANFRANSCEKKSQKILRSQKNYCIQLVPNLAIIYNLRKFYQSLEKFHLKNFRNLNFSKNSQFSIQKNVTKLYQNISVLNIS